MLGMFLIALAGFGAQMVDGSLGMGYGLTSSTLLIAIGLVATAVILLTRPLSSSVIVWTTAVTLLATLVLQLARRPTADAPVSASLTEQEGDRHA